MRFLIVAFIFIGITTSLSAQKERKLIREGYKLYNDSNYIESEIAFKKAIDKLEDGQESFEAEFNLGGAYFQQEKYEDALNQFKSIPTEELNKEQKALLNHNMGNSFMANEDLDNAINSYKTALRNNPLDDETRYNLIAAMKMKQDQEDEEQDQDEDEDEQDQEQDDQEQEQNEDQQDQNEDEQNQDQQDQEQNQEQQEQQQNNISQEDAQRILEALNQDEQELQEKMQKIEEAAPINIEKNW